MHRNHREPGIEQALDQKPVGPLDRDQRHPLTQQPGAQRPDPPLVVAVATPLHNPAPLIHDADRVLLAGPVDPGEPPVTHHHHRPFI
jgi:hypothetical protein